ncbi:MAG: toast rack family protein [Candidatus Acidiferrum sp.]
MSQDYRVRRSSVVFPLLLIGIGLLFLLTRWMPDFYPWPVLWKYWPLLLILVGAGMFWDRAQRSGDPQGTPAFPVGSAIGTVLFLLILGFLMWHWRGATRHDWMNVSAGSGRRAQETQVVELKDAKAVNMTVHMPSGELHIAGGATQLMEGDFSHGPSWAAPSVEYTVEKGVGSLSINQQSANQLVTNSDNIWKLKVSNEVPLELEVDVGAGRGDLNLAKVDLTRLELNIGAGQANVDLTGERGKDLQAEIHGGVGEAVIRLPKNVGVVATVHGGLGSVDVHGLKEEDGEYTNAAYGKAPNTIHLTVEGGIGHIKLEQE